MRQVSKALAGVALALGSCKFDPLPNLPDAAGPPAYAIGGTVEGLWSGAALRLRLTPAGGEPQQLTVTQEGTFAFPGRLLDSTAFTIEVEGQPELHTCTIADPQGEVAGADVADRRITCTSSIVVSVGALGPFALGFDPQVSATEAVPVSLLQSEVRVVLDGPSGSTGAVDGAPLAYQTASPAVPLAIGASAVVVDFTIGNLARRYTLHFDRGGVDASAGEKLVAQVRESGDGFGGGVAGSHDRLVVGATGDDGSGNTLSNTGAAYVLQRNGSTWSIDAQLQGTNTAALRQFGSAVDIDGDTVAIANRGTNRSVWIFRRSVSGWREEQRLDAPEGGEFGSDVAVSGDLLAVADQIETEAPTTRNGAVHIYRRTSTTWTLEATLRAPARGSDDRFGRDIDLSGDTVIVGAPSEDSGATGVSSTAAGDDTAAESGAAYVFRRNGVAWTLEAYLKAANAGAEDGFGTSVAIWHDEAVVGAPGEDSGNGLPSDNSRGDAGAGYVFRRNDTTWVQDGYLKAEQPAEYDGLGVSSSIRAGAVAFGLGTMNDAPPSVTMFQRRGGTWQRGASLSFPGVRSGDNFASTFELFGEGLAVGAPGLDDRGACYVYR